MEAGVGPVTHLAFDALGRLAVAGQTGEIAVWSDDLQTRSHLLKRHDGSVFRVLFTPDGQRLFSTGADHLVKLWDATSGLEILTLPGTRMPSPVLPLLPMAGCSLPAAGIKCSNCGRANRAPADDPPIGAPIMIFSPGFDRLMLVVAVVFLVSHQETRADNVDRELTELDRTCSSP